MHPKQHKKKVLLSLDSRNGTLSPVTTDFATQMPGVSMHSSSHTLVRPLKNASAISLKSVELPITSDNVRTVNYSHALWFTFYDSGAGIYQPSVAVMAASNYTSVAALMTAFNTSLSSLVLLNGMPKPTASYNLISNNMYKVVISWTPLSPTGSYIRLQDYGSLKNMLGFTGGEVFTGTTTFTLTATYGVNLNPENYYNISIFNNQFNFKTMNNVKDSPSTFKLPVTATKGTIQFWMDEAGFKQRREINGYSTDTMLNDLTVRVTDRWGYDIPYLAEFSITLEIECDE